MIAYSVLDLSPIAEGASATDALRQSLDLAQHAELWGYKRYWLAEHHNMPGIASAATAVAIGHVAGGTKTIRVGSGGIMLPNHSPLVIAEQFGTLAALYPARIDLGLGRAPGTDPFTMRALRRDAEARRQFSSLQQSFTLLRRGTPGKVPPPIEDIDSFWSPAEKAMGEEILLFSVVGSPEKVERGLRQILELTQLDELILAAHIYDHRARLRSFEIAASVRDRLKGNTEQQGAAISAN